MVRNKCGGGGGFANSENLGGEDIQLTHGSLRWVDALKKRDFQRLKNKIL